MEWRMALEHLYLLPVCWQLFQYDPGAKSRACTWAEFFERKIGITNKTLFSPWLSGSCHGGVQKSERVCCTSSWLALNRFDTYYTHVTASIISNPEMWTDYRANHRGIGKACSLQKHQESRLFSLGDKKLYLCETNLAKAEMIRPNFGHILINHK